MREMLLSALKSYYVGNINKHIANVEIYLRTSVGIGEHSDIQNLLIKRWSRLISMMQIINDNKIF